MVGLWQEKTQVHCSQEQKIRKEMAQYGARGVGRQRFTSVKDFSLGFRSNEMLGSRNNEIVLRRGILYLCL